MKNYCPKCLKMGILEQGIKTQGCSDYCYKHYRVLVAMRSSKRNKKVTPSFDYLISIIPHDMLCNECGREMIWNSELGYHGDVISLQHWPSGEVSWICCSCNTAHGNTKCLWSDYTKMDVHSKWCPQCKRIKNKRDFAQNKSVPNGLQGTCKSCGNLKYAEKQAARLN
jgi:hypothetical protein